MRRAYPGAGEHPSLSMACLTLLRPTGTTKSLKTRARKAARRSGRRPGDSRTSQPGFAGLLGLADNIPASFLKQHRGPEYCFQRGAERIARLAARIQRHAQAQMWFRWVDFLRYEQDLDAQADARALGCELMVDCAWRKGQALKRLAVMRWQRYVQCAAPCWLVGGVEQPQPPRAAFRELTRGRLIVHSERRFVKRHRKWCRLEKKRRKKAKKLAQKRAKLAAEQAEEERRTRTKRMLERRLVYVIKVCTVGAVGAAADLVITC